MDQLEQPQPARVETSHFNIVVTPESLRIQERRLASLGQRDERATGVFQHYHLHGQKCIRKRKGEEQVEVVRGLIDPEEYVIVVDKNNGGVQLLKIVDEDQKAFAEGWKKYGIQGEPPLYSSLEIIVGITDVPERCYRYKVLDAKATGDSDKIMVIVEQNVEHEKGGVFKPYRVTGRDEKPEPKEGSSDPDTTPSSMVAVDYEEFTDFQKELMEEENLSPTPVFGKRIKNLIAHQRAPKGMTRFADDVAKFEIDLEKTNLWVVAVSGDAVEAHFKKN